MSLKSCSDCGRQVSSKAHRCPNCGRKNPTRSVKEDQSESVLVTSSMLRRPKGRCRECGKQASLGGGACPACGFTNPTDNAPRRWFAVAAVGACLALLSAAAWKLGLLDTWGAGPRGIESAIQATTLQPAVGPPRVRSARFGTTCPAPAPVYVYKATETPSAFLVVLAKPVTDPERAADSLAERYNLTTDGYRPSRGGFVVSLDPPTVSKLRCEAAVRMLEENAAVGDGVTAVEP